MPYLIEHIDSIARRKQRDVLFVEFPQADDEDSPAFFNDRVDWDSLPVRQQIIAWLEQNHITWWRCAPYADEDSMIEGDSGLIYIDVPFELNDPVYQCLQNYLETPEGEMKFPGARFCYLPLKSAMKNAHHDAPE